MHQLLYRYAVMVRLQFVCGSRVIPLALRPQSQATGQGTFLAGIAAVSQGIVQRSDVWVVGESGL